MDGWVDLEELIRLRRKSVGRNGSFKSWSQGRGRKLVSYPCSVCTLSLMHASDRIKVRKAMESSLLKAAMKIVSIVNRDKDHIPPILTSDQNPFPYKILVNPKQQQGLDRGFGGWT